MVSFILFPLDLCPGPVQYILHGLASIYGQFFVKFGAPLQPLVESRDLDFLGVERYVDLFVIELLDVTLKALTFSLDDSIDAIWAFLDDLTTSELVGELSV